jgi:hypothetical protein
MLGHVLAQKEKALYFSGFILVRYKPDADFMRIGMLRSSPFTLDLQNFCVD